MGWWQHVQGVTLPSRWSHCMTRGAISGLPAPGIGPAESQLVRFLSAISFASHRLLLSARCQCLARAEKAVFYRRSPRLEWGTRWSGIVSSSAHEVLSTKVARLATRLERRDAAASLAEIRSHCARCTLSPLRPRWVRDPVQFPMQYVGTEALGRIK